MIRYIRWWLGGACLLFTHVSYSQSGLNIQFAPNEINAQFYQPAYLAENNFENFGVGVGAEYGLGANTLTINNIFMTDNFINQDEKDRLVGRMDDDNRLRINFDQSLIANFESFGQRFSVSYQSRQAGYFRVNAPHTAGLVLYGNAPYAGQTLTDENITLRNYQLREFGIGSAWKWDMVSAGFRLKLLSGSNANLTEQLSYSLFTAEDGSQITLNSDYLIANADNGLGFGVDLGLVIHPDERLSIQAAVRDLGLINWDATIFENQVSVDYTGIDLNQFISTEFSSGGELFSLDTLQELFFPDSVSGTHTMNLPAHASLAASFEISEGKTLSGSIHTGLSQYSKWSSAPLVMLGYSQQFGNALTLGVNAYAGGIEGYGFGAWARGEFIFSGRYAASIFLSADNASGWLIPDQSGGFGLQGGVSFRLVPPSTAE